jgi:putrescine transport system permease protein
MPAAPRIKLGKWAVISPPLFYLFLFFLIPFLFAFKISLADKQLSIPPFTDLISYGEQGWVRLSLSFAGYDYLLTDDLYIVAYLFSVKLALVATLLCLAIGYPMAYAIARARKDRQKLLVLLIMLPFWTSFLLRIYALEGIIRENGLLNNFLIWTGIISHPLQIMQTDLAVQIGIVYSYLPFMVLPLYATLEKMDLSLLEAASDLGSKPWRAFLDVTLPLSMPGIIAGSMLTFIPAIGEFVIPSILGGSDSLMIGRVLWDEFFVNRDWPVASAVSIVFLLFLVAPLAIFQHFFNRPARD